MSANPPAELNDDPQPVPINWRLDYESALVSNCAHSGARRLQMLHGLPLPALVEHESPLWPPPIHQDEGESLGDGTCALARVRDRSPPCDAVPAVKERTTPAKRTRFVFSRHSSDGRGCAFDFRGVTGPLSSRKTEVGSGRPPAVQAPAGAGAPSAAPSDVLLRRSGTSSAQICSRDNLICFR